MKKVIFVYVENAGRSQMAAAFANHYGPGKIIAHSAGTMPGKQVNPLVVEAMKDKGIDISKNRPSLIDWRQVEEADAVITMGCSVEEYCPRPLLKKAVDWGLEDPKGKSLDQVREIRDEIERRVKALLSTL